MYRISEKTRKISSDIMQITLGISYEEFEQLDFDEQQKLIKEYYRKHPQKESDEVDVMIGEGEHSIFISAKKDEQILIGQGESSCFVKAEITSEEDRKKLDTSLYKHPTLVKKRYRGLNK